MDDLWDRFEAWLAEHLPAGRVSLRPGASLGQLREAEAQLGLTFPPDLRASFLRHDGQDDEGPDLTPHGRLLPLQEVVETWQLWTDLLEGGEFEGNVVEADLGVRPVWWHRGWIPLTTNGAGDELCADLAPTELGTPGQLIEVWHADHDRPLYSRSFRDYLEDLVAGLELGEYGHDAEMDRLMRERPGPGSGEVGPTS